jgi:inosine triphosphate pyrophosphatase
MNLDLTFITGNQNKADFLAKWLDHPVKHHKLDLDELQSLDLHTVVEHKVRQAYNIIKQPTLVEDVSFTFAYMGRLPGTFIKWFIEELGYEGVHKLALAFPNREAIAKVCYGFYDGQDLKMFDGEMKGRISNEPRGSGGFGFDPIFINEGYIITRAEMNEDDYAKTSYRTQAIEKLKQYLSKRTMTTGR